MLYVDNLLVNFVKNISKIMVDKDFSVESACIACFSEISKTQFPAQIQFNKKMGGTVTVSSKSFNKIFDVRNMELHQRVRLISGELNNARKFTVINPFLVKRSISGGIYTLVFTFNILILDAKFSSYTNIKCKEFRFSVSGLSNYLYSGKDHFSNSGATLELESSLPVTRSINVSNDLSINFVWSHITSTKIENLQFSVAKDLAIQLVASKAITFRNLLVISEKIEVFIGLLFNQKVVTYNHSGRSITSGRYSMFIKEAEIDSRLSQLKFHDSVFEMKFSPETFERTLCQFLNGFDVLRDIYLLVYENLGTYRKFSTNQFLNAAQAIEAYHRNIHNKLKISSEESKALRARIKKSITKDDYSAIANSLAFLDQMSLKERLDDLITLYGTKFFIHIGFDEDFCKKLRDTRNLYTHLSGSSKKSIFTSSEVYYATVKINVVLTFMLLVHLGLDQKELEQAMIKFWDRRYYFYK